MKAMLTSAAIFVLSAPAASAQQVVLQRGMPQRTVEILLATDDLGLTSGMGDTTRKADHATVVTNEDLDIAVAFEKKNAADDLRIWLGIE